MSYSQGAVATLLVMLVVGVQGHQIIYVDTENGTLNNSCWKGGLDHPCGSLKLADTGAQRYNSTIAVVWRYGTNHHAAITAPNTPQALSCLPLPTKCIGVCRCHEQADNHMCDSMSGQSSNASCPPWFEPSNGTCKCGKTIHDIVECDETRQESAILQCYCMTYNGSTGTVVVGACLYNCVRNISMDVVYSPVPKTVEKLNHYMCGDFNRDGQLCSECKTNYSPPVYSYDLQCTMCSGSQYDWMKYVAIAFVPLTGFLVLILCFRVSATSPKLNAFVMFSQAVAFPANVRVLLAVVNSEFYPSASIAVRIALALYGFWNLDFFRTFISHQICLNVNTLQTLALDYSIAFYPLALIVVTYVLIDLHAHNYRAIVWMWRPFHKCFARLRQQWDIRTSIIDAFATFLILSNIKLLSVSYDLLTPTYVFGTNGSVVGVYLYYDASIEYFGSKHLPYAILALFVVLIFIIFPILLLLLYPMRCFQRCLSCCGVRWHVLPIFIDAFRGCYKDGTSGTRDCRYFSTIYLIMRLLFCILFAITRTVIFYSLATCVLIGVVMLIAIVQPYKLEFATYNVVDLVFVLSLTMWYSTAVFYSTATVKAHDLVDLSVVVSILVGALPLLYLVAIILYWIGSFRGFGQRLVQCSKRCIKRVWMQVSGARIEESLPDRLINPCHYVDESSLSLASSPERFSNQAYLNATNDGSTTNL